MMTSGVGVGGLDDHAGTQAPRNGCRIACREVRTAGGEAFDSAVGWHHLGLDQCDPGRRYRFGDGQCQARGVAGLGRVRSGSGDLLADQIIEPGKIVVVLQTGCRQTLAVEHETRDLTGHVANGDIADELGHQGRERDGGKRRHDQRRFSVGDDQPGDFGADAPDRFDRQVVGGGELTQGLAFAGDKRAVGDRHARQRGEDIGRRNQRREGRAGHADRRGGIRDHQQPRRERAQGLHRQQRRRRGGNDDRAAGVGRI